MSSVMVTTNYQMKSLSTLELMLEELQQEEEETNNLPPPLPVRPVIKARLPKGRRKLTTFGKEKRKLEDIRVQENEFVDQWSTSEERDSAAMTDKVNENDLKSLLCALRKTWGTFEIFFPQSNNFC